MPLQETSLLIPSFRRPLCWWMKSRLATKIHFGGRKRSRLERRLQPRLAALRAVAQSIWAGLRIRNHTKRGKQKHSKTYFQMW